MNQSFLVPKDIDFLSTQCYAVNGKKEIKLLQEDGFLFVQDRLSHNATNPEEDRPDEESKPKMMAAFDKNLPQLRRNNAIITIYICR